MASVFGPITLSNCPLLVFKRAADSGEWLLVATGSLSSVDPDRIVLKKVSQHLHLIMSSLLLIRRLHQIILTGIPIRVRKKFAVVKHMFHQTEDVRWFKPAELATKRGLRGTIKEPVGTHGLFKAQFSGPITQNDTVMLVLYKRVFPKVCVPGTLADVAVL